MKMTRLYITMLFFCAPLLVASQDFNTSPGIDFSSQSDHVQILGTHNDLIYVHVHDNKDHKLLAYYKSLRLNWRREIPFDHRQYEYQELYFDNGRMIMLYTERVKQQKKLYGKIVDANAEVDTNTIALIDTMNKSIGESFSDFTFARSQNKAYNVALWIDENLFSDNFLHYVIFNNQLEVKEKGQVKMPFTGSRTGFHSLVLSNEGKVFVVVAEYTDQDQDNGKLFWIMSSDNQFQDYNHMELRAEEGLYLNNVRFKVDNTHETITVVGFYAEESSGRSGAEGVFFSRIPFDDSQPMTTRYEPFSKDFIARVKGTKRSRKNDKLYSFIIDKVTLRRDGGLLLVAESFYKTYRSSNYLYDVYGFPSRQESTVIYHFDELIVMSIHPSGKVHWQNIIAKHQSSSGDYGRYSSYQMMNSGMFLKFIFNEKISNRSNLIEYTMDVNGQMKREVLLNSKNQDVYLMPQFGEQISTDKMILPSLKRGELKILQLDYQLE